MGGGRSGSTPSPKERFRHFCRSDLISSEEKEYTAPDDREQDPRTASDQSEGIGPTSEGDWPSHQDDVQSTTSSGSFKSDRSKNSDPDFKGQSSLRSELMSSEEKKEDTASDDGEQSLVSVENQHCVSTESDGRDGHTEELKEGKSSFKKMVGDAVRRLVRRVSRNNMES